MPDNPTPLVSCIMPTHNRRAFVPLAITYFMRQDYAVRELIVVDDGADAVGDLMPSDERIRYIRLSERASVGAKRNLACAQARGAIVAHWDDDDWHAPHRLRYQVEALVREGTDICGINRLLFYDMAAGRAWQYTYPAGQQLWLSGSTLCYTRAFWAGHQFENVDVGEDARFVWSDRSARMTVLPDSTIHIGLMHGHNVSPKHTSGACWQAYPVEEIRRLLGADWSFYQPENSSAHTRPQSMSRPLEQPPVAPIRNIFACLVHESQECVIDLVRNLRYLDLESVVLLYNGGDDPHLLSRRFPFEQYGAVLHPQPRRQSWGKLHDFALDCMRFALDHLPFDTMTIVDSGQLAVRRGYSHYLAQFLAGRSNIGMLCNSPERQPPTTQVGPAAVAFQEIELWRPFLKRFDHQAWKNSSALLLRRN